MKIFKRIREGEKMPIGYGIVGISPQFLGIEIGLLPFNYIKREYWKFVMKWKKEKWEKRILRELNIQRSEAYQEGKNEVYSEFYNKYTDWLEHAVEIFVDDKDLGKAFKLIANSKRRKKLDLLFQPKGNK